MNHICICGRELEILVTPTFALGFCICGTTVSRSFMDATNTKTIEGYEQVLNEQFERLSRKYRTREHEALLLLEQLDEAIYMASNT